MLQDRADFSLSPLLSSIGCRSSLPFLFCSLSRRFIWMVEQGARLSICPSEDFVRVLPPNAKNEKQKKPGGVIVRPWSCYDVFRFQPITELSRDATLPTTRVFPLCAVVSIGF